MAGLLPAIGLPLGVSVGVSSDVPATGSILTGGQTGPGTGTPSTSTSNAIFIISANIISIVLVAVIIGIIVSTNTKHPDTIINAISNAITNADADAVISILKLTPSSHDVYLPPLPSPTSIPVEIPISTPILTPSPTPSFIPPPPVPLSDTTLTPTPTPTPSLVPGNGIAAPSQAEQASGGSNVKLMPALPIALGSVGGVLIFGLILGMLYRKSKWPFHGRRNFAQLDELEVERQQEMERQNKLKWDPRMTRAYKPQGPGVNF
ncbi:hypothetical protein EsH8_II_000316 [Colletotrichum jinshuiense]